MRRLVFSIIVASGLAMMGAGPAFAEADPTAGAAKAVPGKKICKVTDPRLDEVSGIVATRDGFVVINDSALQESHRKVFFLDDACSVTKSVGFSGGGPRDTEDMVLSADGKTLWIADTGDNDYSDGAKRRSTIGVWTMPVSGSQEPKLHRLAYPDGDHHDAEALLLNGDGAPIIVTKEVGRAAVLYTPAAALKTGNEVGVPLKKVGEIQPPASSTPGNSLARIGSRTVTGAAIAPDGVRVALRTYTDALEWDVSGGDVIAALKATPRSTPLPDEPLGEAITYSSDGTYFYTVSDMQGSTDTDGENANYILRYTPVTKVVTTTAADGSGGAAKAAGSAWYKNLSLDDITYLVGGVGVLGVLLVGLGIFGIVRARRNAPPEPAADKIVDGGPAKPKAGDAQTALLAVGGPPASAGGRPVSGAPQGQRPGVYGGNRAGAAQPGVYGGKPAQPAPSTPQRGGVYGGQGGAQAPGQSPARPAAQPAGRPPQPPPRPGQPAARPPQGQPGRPAQGQPGRPAQGQPGRPPEGGQPGGRPGKGGVYGAPPPTPPTSRSGANPSPGRSGANPPPRPSGFFGQGNGRPDGNSLQAARDLHGYADVNGAARPVPYDNPGYGR
jgi:hypothetical protein